MSVVVVVFKLHSAPAVEEVGVFNGAMTVGEISPDGVALKEIPPSRDMRLRIFPVVGFRIGSVFLPQEIIRSVVLLENRFELKDVCGLSVEVQRETPAVFIKFNSNAQGRVISIPLQSIERIVYLQTGKLSQSKTRH